MSLTKLETSRKLFEAGFTLKSKILWVKSFKTKNFELRNRAYNTEFYYSFTSDELLEALPSNISHYYLVITKIEKGYAVEYGNYPHNYYSTGNEKLCEALTSMVLWLLSNGYKFTDGKIKKE